MSDQCGKVFARVAWITALGGCLTGGAVKIPDAPLDTSATSGDADADADSDADVDTAETGATIMRSDTAMFLTDTSVAFSDTGTEGFSDTASQDTAPPQDTGSVTPTDTGDPYVDPCLFSIEAYDGSVVLLRNEPTITIDGASPTGEGFPVERMEVLRVDLGVKHPECPPLKVEALTMRIDVTDWDSRNWVFDMAAAPIDGYDLTMYGLDTPVMTKGYAVAPDRTFVLADLVGTSWVSQFAHAYSFWADPTGASDPSNDCLAARVVANSLTVSDGATSVRVRHDDIKVADLWPICF